jgi:hypothetical protein
MKGGAGSGQPVENVAPRCPACNQPMKEDGHAFRCEGCRQIILYFAVQETPTFAVWRELHGRKPPSMIDQAVSNQGRKQNPADPAGSTG